MIQKLTELKERLQHDKNVELINFNFFPGVEDHVLKAIEKDMELPTAIRNFYRHTNGWQVRWYYKSNDKVTPADFEKEKPFDWMWPAEHYWQLDGVINILPLDFLLQQGWKDFTWFDFEAKYQVTYKDNNVNLLDFKKAVKPLDIFDKYFTAAFYTKDQDMPVLLGEDHNAEFLSFKPLTFEKYLELVIEHNGLVNARAAFFEKVE